MACSKNMVQERHSGNMAKGHAAHRDPRSARSEPLMRADVQVRIGTASRAPFIGCAKTIISNLRHLTDVSGTNRLLPYLPFTPIKK